MSSAQRNYSVRLSVIDGGKVRSELVDIGNTGEKSFSKLETGSKKASGGFANINNHSSMLSAGIRQLEVAAAGIATVGGLGMLINSSLETADNIGKAADKLGIGVEALQEYRYAAELAGVENEAFDKAMSSFTRKTFEAAKGSGDAKESLDRLGISLKDNHGNLKTSDELLMNVSDAFTKVKNPAERLSLAFNLFGKEGVSMVNMLSSGSAELEKTRQQARDLGIVLEEGLVCNAETAKDGIEILSKVISINLTKAMLDLAPIITDTTGLLANFASTAGVAYEKLKLIFKGDFEFKGLSKHGLETSIKSLQEAIEMMQKAKDSQPDTWLGNVRSKNLTKMIDEETVKLQKYQAQLAVYNDTSPQAKTPTPYAVSETDYSSTNKGLEKKNELEKKGLEIKQKYASAESLYNEQLKELNTLLQAGAINQKDFEQASLDAYNEMLDKSTNWFDGIKRGFRDYAAEGSDAAKSFETATKNALKSSEDAFVSFVKTGKLEASDLFSSIADEALRMAYKMAVINPLSSIFEGVFSSIGGSLFSSTSTPTATVPVAHTGGVIGTSGLFSRTVDMGVFTDAPRYHSGGLVDGEVPIIAKRGERVLTAAQNQAYENSVTQTPQVNVKVNVNNNASNSQATASYSEDSNGDLTLDVMVEQVEKNLSRNISKGSGLAPTLENRYGLNPARGSYG